MIFVLNCGSQSIKWKLFDDSFTLKKEGEKDIFNPKRYRSVLVRELKKLGEFREDISIVGHRVVHGGERFIGPRKVTEKDLKELKWLNKLAPLHNPFNLLGIKIASKFFKGIPQFAVFDTEFYAGLPEKSSVYPLPKNVREKFGFKRYGFHGISHEYAAKEGAKRVKKPFKKLKIITCHLGGGSSITAIKNGKVIDTSMGFTPMEGLTMMTRTGDIDPGIILELARNISLKKVDKILNFESGLKGISGKDNMLDILDSIKEKNKRAKLSLEIFTYRVQKYIGAYFAVLGGCDLLVFTGSIGSGRSVIRNMICKNLNILKSTKIIIIKANEELAIAQKIYEK